MMFAALQKFVRKIPRGKVATYGEVARAAGYPGAARQVVWALRATKGLPWHRVVGARGRILLPGEAGLVVASPKTRVGETGRKRVGKLVVI